jgi:hypothetical protein
VCVALASSTASRMLQAVSHAVQESSTRRSRRRRARIAHQAVRRPHDRCCDSTLSHRPRTLLNTEGLWGYYLLAGFCPTAGAVTRMVFVRCSAGTYSSVRGATSNATCTPCPLGKQSLQRGASSSKTCRDCLPGSFASDVGSTACSSCSTATYQANAGTTACVPCRRGTYASVDGSATCINCLDRLSSAPGMESCDGVLPRLGSCKACHIRAV